MGDATTATDPSAFDALLASVRDELAQCRKADDPAVRCDRAGALVSAMERVIGEVVIVRDEAAQEILLRSPRTHTPTQVADLMHITKGGLKQKMDRWGIPSKQPA